MMELPAFGEQRSDESWKSSDLAAENAGRHRTRAFPWLPSGRENGKR
jgi:hypothetical protein